jgi:hypothetical protein
MVKNKNKPVEFVVERAGAGWPKSAEELAVEY